MNPSRLNIVILLTCGSGLPRHSVVAANRSATVWQEANTSVCKLVPEVGRCDGISDDTASVQAAFDHCAAVGETVIIGRGARCTAQPLRLRSHSHVWLEANATIKAGKKWSMDSHEGIKPFILAENVTNVTVSGMGTIDGNGAEWWPKSRLDDAPRPRLLVFLHSTNVLLQHFTLLNSAFWTLVLSGRDFSVAGIRVRAPDFQTAPNTDGSPYSHRQAHALICIECMRALMHRCSRK